MSAKVKIKSKDIYIGMIINNWKILSEKYIKYTKSGNKVTYVKALCLGCNIEYEKILQDILRETSKQCKECTNPKRFISNVYVKNESVYIEINDTKENKVYVGYADLKFYDYLNKLNYGLVFSSNNRPYIRITSGLKCEFKIKSLHRYVCFLEYGYNHIENKIIDHKNRDTLNNTISNLNIVTALENTQNHSIRKDNTSSVTGVVWNKKSSKWYAVINVNNKNVHLGSFDNFEDAVNSRKRAEHKYYTYNESIKLENNY